MGSGYSDVVKVVLTGCMTTLSISMMKDQVPHGENLKFLIHSLSLWLQWVWHWWDW